MARPIEYLATAAFAVFCASVALDPIVTVLAAIVCLGIVGLIEFRAWVMRNYGDDLEQ